MTEPNHAPIEGQAVDAEWAAPLPSASGDVALELRRRLVFAQWGTGAFTVISAVGSLVGFAVGDEVTSLGLAYLALALIVLNPLAGIAGWVTLARWMSAVSDLRLNERREVPAGWQIWGSWFIPIYSFWGPFSAMRKLTAELDELNGARQRWWNGWIVAGVAGSFAAVFGSTLYELLSGAALVFSFVMLRTVLTKATDAYCGD